MAIDLEFKGIGTELLETLTEAAERTAKLRAEVSATAEAQTKGVATAVNAQQKYVQGLDAVISAVTKIGSQQSGVNKLSQDTDKATTSAKGLTVALTEAERTAFAGLIEQAKELLQTQHNITAAVTEEDQAVAALLVKMGALSQEEADLVVQAQAVTRAFADQGVSVDGVTKEIAKQGEGLRSNVGLLTQAQARIDEARNKLGTASSVEEIGKINDQIAEATAAYNVLATASERASNAADQGLTEQIGLLAQLESRIDLLNQKLDSAQTPEAIAIINDELAAASEEYERVATASQQSGAIQAQALRQPLGIIDQLRSRIALLEQKKATLVDPKAVAQVNQQIKEVQKRLQDIDGAGTGGGIESLRAQFMQAKNEAAAMVTEFGRFSPEAQAALQKAANLKDELGDLNATLDALNPDAKFQAFGQTLTALAGGFQAVQGAVGLLGKENEDVQAGLLKIQQVAAVTQGLQTFFGNFSDGLKNIRAVLGLTTVAQVQNTAATEADTVAKTAQATATTAVGTASVGSVTGIRAFTAALIASPFAPVILALTGLAAAFALVSDEEEKATQSHEDYLKSLQGDFELRSGEINLRNAQRLQQIEEDRAQRNAEVSAGKRKDAEMTAQELEAQRIALKKIDDATIQNIRARLAAEEASAKELERQVNNLDKLSEAERQRLTNALSLEDDATGNDIIKAFNAVADGFANSARAAVAQITEIETGSLAKSNDRKDKQIQDQADLAAKVKDIREKLADSIEQIEKQLQDRLKALQLEQADPGERLNLERAAAQEELSILELKLRRELALREVAAARLIGLSEKQKESLADSVIAQGGGQFDPAQLQAFAQARLLIEKKYLDDVVALQQQNDKTLSELVTDRNEREQKELEATLIERAEKLRLAGATEAEIEADAQRKRADLGKGQAQRSRDIEEEIAIARVEAIKEGGDLSADAQREAELKILAIKLAARQADLAALGDAQDEETRKRRAELEKMISSLQGAIKVTAAQREPLDMFDLLGIKFDDDKQKQAVSDAVNNVIALVEQSIAAQQAEVDAQISATDELIADRERRGDSLEQQLDREIELAKLGLANNVDSVRAQIAENDKAIAADKAQKARLIEEKKRLARQQLAIDAATQASALITTGANLLANESLKGIVGVIAGIGFFASVFAAFAALKARAAAINSGAGPNFRKGGGMGAGMLEGPYHEQGGLGIYNERTGERVGEAEGDEAAIYFVRREHAKKSLPMLKAINDNDLTTVARLALKELNRSERVEVYGMERTDHASQAVRELMETRHVTLSRERVQEAVELKHTHENRTTITHKLDNDRLLQEVKSLRKDVQGFKDQERRFGETTVEHRPDGSRIERRPGIVKVVRKAKPKV